MQYVNLTGQKRCHCANHWKLKSSANLHRFYRYTTFQFSLKSVLFCNQLMSTQKQFPSLCKLYSVYDEIPEELLDKTDVDSFFITTFWTVHSPTTELFELAKDPTENFWHSKCFIFAIQSYSSDFFSKKKSAFLKTNMHLYSTV